MLGGTGRSWQDGTTYEVREGDCILHLVEAEAHTLIAGPDGLDVLAFGPRRDGLLTILPRAGIAMMPDFRMPVGKNKDVTETVAMG